MATEEGESAGRASDFVSNQRKPLPTPILKTRRFTLRPLVREDAEALFPTLSDPEVCQYLLRSAFESVEDLDGWLCDPEWNGRSWAAIDDKAQALVARVVAVPVSEGVSEIGYTVVAHRTGQGIASECASRIVQYLFEDEGHHRLAAGTDPRNEASNAVLRRLGFRQEGHLLQSVKTHMGWCDEFLWGLLASEWKVNQIPSL